MTNKIVYRYIGDLSKSRKNGVITVATSRESGKLRLGMSFCSPKDHFVKEKGRKIAVDRMVDESTKYEIEIPEDLGNMGVTNTVKNFVFSQRTSYPSWATKLFRAEGFLSYRDR